MAIRRRHGLAASPVLWRVGGEDPLVPPAAMQDAAALTPGSERAVIEGCGHSACFEKPAVFNHLVLDFIGRRVVG